MKDFKFYRKILTGRISSTERLYKRHCTLAGRRVASEVEPIATLRARIYYPASLLAL